MLVGNNPEVVSEAGTFRWHDFAVLKATRLL